MVEIITFLEFSDKVVEVSRIKSQGKQRGFSVGPERDLAFYARRLVLSGSIATGHILLLVAVLSSGWNMAAPAAERRLAVIDVSVGHEPSTPARPAKMPQVSPVKQIVLLPSEVAVPMLSAASGSGDGSGCAMTAVVARAITENPEAMAELAALPPELRTEADAVMLWNGTWLPVDEPPMFSLTPPEDPLGALKKVVIAALAATPIECLDVEAIGPQLIPIQEPGRTTMLVVGSGVWRWSSVLDPPIDLFPSIPSFQAAELSLFAPTPKGN